MDPNLQRALRLALPALLTAMVLALSPTWARAGDWYVDDGADCARGDGSAGNPFCTIGEALAASAAGDTIHVAAGSYSESLRIEHDLRILGEGTAGAVVRGDPPLIVADAVLEASGLALTGSKSGGLFVSQGATVQLTRCSIRENSSNREGGGILNYGRLSLVSCDVSANFTTSPWVDSPTPCGGGIFNAGDLSLTTSSVRRNFCGAEGGGLLNAGTASLERCRVESNFTYDNCFPACSPAGGGIYNAGSCRIAQCTLRNNEAAGSGGGIMAVGSGELHMVHSTVLGNTAAYDGGGGGIGAEATVQLGHTIVAGNASPSGVGPDCHGTITSLGHDLIGDTADCTVVGDETGNLYDLDPLLEGDGRLQPGSPCIDAGDPAFEATGTALGGNLRVLDGDLDRSMVVDIGAYEWANLRLSASGEFRPGGRVTIDLSGDPALTGTLIVGLDLEETLLRPYGALSVDLGSPWFLRPLGPLPASLTGTLPPQIPPGLPLVFQGLGVQRPGGAGNLSIAIPVIVQ